MTEVNERHNLEERLEAQIWAGFLAEHSNPLLRDGAAFLAEFYDLEVSFAKCPITDDGSIPVEQRQEVEAWAAYLADHSLDGLRELAEFMPQWHYSGPYDIPL